MGIGEGERKETGSGSGASEERNTASAVSQVNKRKTNLKTRQTLDQ